MVSVEVKKELVAKIRLSEVDIEARVVITPQGEVEIGFMPWSQWRMSGESFDQLVEDYNLLKYQIKLCLENQKKEQLKNV
jgi:hypothetical protein